MVATILVVEVKPELELLIRQELQHGNPSCEFNFLFARDSEEALNLLRAHREIDLVFSDSNVQGMGDFALLDRLKDFGPLLKSVIMSPVDNVAGIRQAMNHGASDFVIKPVQFSELQTTIAKALHDLNILRDAVVMRDAAERARANLARYFAPTIATMLAGVDEPFDQAHQQSAALMFVDIVGFTRLCSETAPGRVFDLLRSFLARMAQEVFAAGGTVDKYIGDGLMASFGTPLPGAKDATCALQCALNMRTVMKMWNVEREAAGDKPLRIAIGIHYGPVLLGHVGNEQRFEFATIGETVNVASRLEKLNRILGSEIVISQDLVDQLEHEGAVAETERNEFQRRGAQMLPGRDEPLEVWALAEG